MSQILRFEWHVTWSMSREPVGTIGGMAKRKARQRSGQSRKAFRFSNAQQFNGSDQDWSRSGAHNIAGISFQVLVTARLLLDGFCGRLPLVRVTPEGFEDIDVEFIDGSRALVQVKERSPKYRFKRSELVTALSKKSDFLSNHTSCRFVLVTNATLGDGISSTGLDEPLSECLANVEIGKLSAQLATSFDDPTNVLNRTHILVLVGSITEMSRSDLADTMAISPSIAALAFARLVERITEISVRQRYATPETAEWIAPSDLKALVTRIQESVDVENLEEAVRAGIVEPVDFGVRSDLSKEDFLAGVDVLPSHIAADLDIPRPTEIESIATGLRDQRSALLTGPSGSGKSALLWRTVRELAGRTRPYRLLRLLPEDVATLARWIRLQEPSNNSPLLLCADNLGRTHSSGWSEIAREFAGRPGILLLGACREEDFRPEIVVGHTVIVDPKLDRRLANSIANTLLHRGVDSKVDVDEAFGVSDGLLMEFLSMLLTGRRLRQIVEHQVSARFVEERTNERAILRYVATAHAAGVSIPAGSLEALIPDRDLTPHLNVLNREHILVVDDHNRWRGLHELRSEVARDYLHSLPPPTIAATVRDLITHLPASDASRVIEFYARSGIELKPAAAAVSELLRSPAISPAEGTVLVDSLAMADAFRHARECLNVVQSRRPKESDPLAILTLAYGQRFAGMGQNILGGNNPASRYLNELAAALPPRRQSLRSMCLEKVSEQTIQIVASRGTPVETTAWLESLEGSFTASVMTIENIWTRFASAPLDAKSRLAASLNALACTDDAKLTQENIGDLEDRVRQVADCLPDCIGYDTRDASDGRLVTLRLLVPENDGFGESSLNERSVRTCRLIFDLCPEADIAEVIVVTPSGDRCKIGDLEPGRKRIPRGNLPRSALTVGNVKFRRAARLLLASRYWTEPLRELAETSKYLLDLRNDACAWLINPHHNSRRRLKSATSTRALIARVTSGIKEPVSEDGGGDPTEAREALGEALSIIQQIAGTSSLSDSQKRSLRARCRSVVGRFIAARKGNLPRLSSIGNPLPDSLDAMFKLLAQVLWAQADRRIIPFVAPRRRRSESWEDVARRLVNAAEADGYRAEMTALGGAIGMITPNPKIQRVKYSDFKSAGFLKDRWVVLIDAGSDDLEPLSFVDRLNPETATQLAFRTFVVFDIEGRILPLNALKLGLAKWWPVDENDLSEIASGLGTEVMRSGNLDALDDFKEKLVNASRAAALMRLRRTAGLASDEDIFRSRFESAREAASQCDLILQPEVNRLLKRIESEAYINEPTFANEFYRTVTHNELSEDMTALVNLRTAALSIDLQE